MLYYIVAIAVALVAVALFVFRERLITQPIVHRRRKAQEERKRERQVAEAKRDREITELLKEGAHIRTPEGRIVEKCCLCDQQAHYPPVRFVRDLGLFAWVKERLGAPRQYSVGSAKFDPPALCEVHVHLVRSHYQYRLQKVEESRARQQRDDELDLQRFERGGALDELRALTSQTASKRRRKESAQKDKENNLVQFARTAGS